MIPKGFNVCLWMLCLWIGILFPYVLSAQEKHPTNLFYSLNFRSGRNVPHRNPIRHMDYPYRGVDFKLGWQTTGSSYWQQAYRYPSFGVGVNWNTFYTDVLGNPSALYFFTNFPQFRWGPLRFDLELNLGISHGIHPYDEVKNPLNMALASTNNGYVSLCLEQTFFWNKRVQCFISEGLSHYSNASKSFPNFGLNIPIIKAGIRYQPTMSEFFSQPTVVLEKRWAVISMLYTGNRRYTDPKTYTEIQLNQSLYYRMNYKHRWGLGYEIGYNEGRGMRGIVKNDGVEFGELITGSYFITHEFLIDRFSILTQFGFYAFNQPADTFYFERLGLGYRFLPNFRAVLNLKAHYVKAEYLEFGVAYDFSW